MSSTQQLLLGEGAGGAAPVYIEDVFSTYLWTGNGSTQTITNNIDLSTKGGMVWIKSRSVAYTHRLFDTNRGATKFLVSNDTLAEDTNASTLTAFTSSGFSVGASTAVNENAATYVSWTFREQPKFFDVVTYTGNATPRTIAHNLGSVPGCIIIKRLNAATPWFVYHRGNTSAGTAQSQELLLNTADNTDSNTNVWNDTAPTSSVFSIGAGPSPANWNASGGTYVAYLFAHDAGGFGAAGTDNVISCGSYVEGGAGTSQTINLGYEVQWLLIKPSSIDGTWYMYDTMRGLSQTGNEFLRANAANAESAGSAPYLFKPAATGFIAPGDLFGPGATIIYMAIRRGPMKVPTDATKVFQVSTTSTARLTGDIYDSNLNPPDLYIFQRLTPFGAWWSDRLRGWKLFSSRGADGEEASNYVAQSGKQDELVYVGNWDSALPYANWYFRRAPGVFDEVCYTGTAPTAQNLTHNLGIAPEFIIIKRRDAGGSWFTGSMFTSTTVTRAVLNDSSDQDLNSLYSGQSIWGGQPTSSVFSVGTGSGANASGGTYVAYLFATCAGVSKVGTYTGTGALQTVNCGFASGVRWVLIKRTDSTGGWYVYDSARGITSGNDPYLFLNNSDGEVTGTNYVDTTSVGFQVTAAAPAGLNASGGTYLFLAIA